MQKVKFLKILKNLKILKIIYILKKVLKELPSFEFLIFSKVFFQNQNWTF